ncbi:MAG: hypothetical protein E7331_05430 [Clostridiales bacterium]|nr:hypothetical protein [Clostridiales bacterium]
MICERCGSYLSEDALTCDRCGEFVANMRPRSAQSDIQSMRQGRAGAAMPRLPLRQGEERSYGDYEASDIPLNMSGWESRSRPAPRMSEASVRGASRPDNHRGAPSRGNARETIARHRPTPIKKIRRSNVNWMLIGIICTVLALGALVGYSVYMSQSEEGQQSTARKNVIVANEETFELATTKDATRLTEQEELLKEWNKAEPHAYWAVANAFVDSGDLDLAITAFRMADILDPENYDGLLEMAVTYELKEDNAKAEEVYLNLINNVSPFRSEAYTYLIRLYQNTDRGPEAADMMKLAYENTERDAFRQQRREYIPMTPETNLTAGRYEISKMEESITLISPQNYDIYYTMDDSAKLPEEGILYDGKSLQITEGSVSLRAVCVNGDLVSDPMSVGYTFFHPTPPAPKSNLAPNTYDSKKFVSLRAGTREEFTKKEQAEMEANLTYYYTIDGSTPTLESPLYDGTPIEMPSGRVTLKAMCVNQYGKQSSILEVGYKFNIKPYPLEVYGVDDHFGGAIILKTTQDEFEQTFGAPSSTVDTTYLHLEAEARHLEYSWGYAEFALINKQWLLVRLDMTSAFTSMPREVGFGASEAEVTGAYKDFGQVQSPNGTRGLYWDYPRVGQVYISEDGQRYIHYSCHNNESKMVVLQYWLDGGRVKHIVNYYQP